MAYSKLVITSSKIYHSSRIKENRELDFVLNWQRGNGKIKLLNRNERLGLLIPDEMEYGFENLR